MGDLKPIGSEKLQGQEKIKRILEIARYKESTPSSINESESNEYSVNLADGNNYKIVKEKSGYIIKKTISESLTDYIEPIKNRKYYSSYSQAFKRLNLMAKEMNTLHGNQEGLSLFGEQKKFVLKTPKSQNEPEPVSDVPAAPPPVPAPELPPSDLGPGDASGENVGDAVSPEMGMSPDSETEAPTDMDMDTAEETGVDDSEDAGGEPQSTFKSVQKLTGKLTQKIRDLEESQGLTSEQIKYVINMVLSSVSLENLNDEDREDILSKFETDEESQEGGEEEISGEEEMGVEDMGGESPIGAEEPSGEVGESGNGHIFDSIFSESKIDKVLSKYFEVSDKEKRQTKQNEQFKRKKNNFLMNRKMQAVRRLSETIEQELASKKFLEENNSFEFIGRSNRKNLIFEFGNRQIKITPKGLIK